MPMQGKALYFPSEPRLLLENLTQSRGPAKKSAGRKAVEARLLNIADTRGDDVLSGLREAARVLARPLGFNKEFLALDSLIRSILGTRTSKLKTVAGKARTTGAPYDPDRLELIEKLAVELRTNPLGNPLRSRPQTKPVPISLSWSPIFRTSPREPSSTCKKTGASCWKESRASSGPRTRTTLSGYSARRLALPG